MEQGSRTSVERNLSRVREAIGTACHRAGRDPGTVALLAVTKNVPADLVVEAIAAGVPIIGENRVQEAEAKFPRVDAGISALRPGPGLAVERHMIGHLQRNKVAKALRLFDCIQSVDSAELAAEIDKRAGQGVCLAPARVLVEVKTSAEETKLGISPGGLWELLLAISRMPNVRVEGLMTVAPYSDNPQAARPYFRHLRELALSMRARLAELETRPGVDAGRGAPAPRNVAMNVLSMGMSADFEVAIEEGSTLVRLGTAIFGPRPAAGQTP